MRTLLVCLLTALVLCGCTAPAIPHEPPELTEPALVVITTTEPTTAEPTTAEPTTTERIPIYDATPAISNKQITIDGLSIQQCYQKGDVTLLSLTDVKSVIHLSTLENEDGSFTCTLRHEEHELSFTNGLSQMSYAGKPVALPAPAHYDGEKWYVPAEVLLTSCGYTQYNDVENNHLYYTLLPDPEKLPEGYDIPCLMYHAVSDDCWGIQELFVSPEELEKQLVYLKDNGYTTITFEDLPYIAEIEKPVLLTFDDGYDDNYLNLYPLLQKYNLKATIFCIGNSFSRPHKLTAEQIKEMSDSGLVSIQSHTMTHPDLDRQDAATQRWELAQSQLELLRITGKQPFVLCYPSGRYNGTTIELAREYYHFGIKMSRGSLITGEDPFYVGRAYISRYTSLDTFASYLS